MEISVAGSVTIGVVFGVVFGMQEVVGCVAFFVALGVAFGMVSRSLRICPNAHRGYTEHKGFGSARPS